jgi:hypothetical protein
MIAHSTTFCISHQAIGGVQAKVEKKTGSISYLNDIKVVVCDDNPAFCPVCRYLGFQLLQHMFGSLGHEAVECLFFDREVEDGQVRHATALHSQKVRSSTGAFF